MVLQAIVSQQLVPGVNGSQEAAFEILKANAAIRTMVREGKIHQIESIMHASAKEGMKTMDTSLAELYKAGKIEQDVAVSFSNNPESIKRLL